MTPHFDLLPPGAAARPSAPPSPLPPPPPPSPRRSRRLARAGAVVGLAGLSLAGGAVGATLVSGHDGATTASSIAASSVSLPASGLTVTEIADAMRSSVVSIETTITVNRGPWSQSGQGAGTGIVLDGGYILTNAHVVADATSVKITGADGRDRTATVVGADTAADVAVLKVSDADGLVPATIAADDTTVVGEDVVAIGNALALEGGLSVTRGIVSALDRSIETSDGTLTHLIQTDAAISSGNSGGPLLDMAGEVIGMNAAVATSSGSVSASNIGFAIDIHQALKVADSLTGSST